MDTNNQNNNNQVPNYNFAQPINNDQPNYNYQMNTPTQGTMSDYNFSQPVNNNYQNINQAQPVNNQAYYQNGMNNQGTNQNYSQPVNSNYQNINQAQPVNNQGYYQNGMNNQYNNQGTNQNYSQPVNNNYQNMNQAQPVNNQGYYQNGMNNQNYYYQNNISMPPNKKINKKIPIIVVASLLILVCCIFLFKSILSNGKTYDRTIMIYMVGSDLEQKLGLATLDLNGINYNKMEAQNTKVVLIAGGANNWNNDYIDVKSTSIYELTSNGYKIVKKQSRQNMGSPSILSNFLNYAYNKYKAKKYDLLFWNHGLGVLGSESDKISGDWLTLTEMNSALNNSPFKNDNKLELVLFRTCLNGTLEVADTLKKYANFMVASQEVTLGYQGNNVLKILNTINSTDTPQQFGTKYVDGYMNYINDLAKMYNADSSSIYKTYSLIDLSKINAVEKSLNDFVKDIDLNSAYSQIAKTRSRMMQYGSEDETFDSIDLYNFISQIKHLSPSKGQTVLSNLDKAIIYNQANDSLSKGLSIYFPYNGDKSSKEAIISRFYRFNDLSEYKNFIIAFNNIKESNTKAIDFSNNVVNLLGGISDNADFQLELTEEQLKSFAKARYTVFEKEENNKFFPVYASNDIDVNGNIIKANIKNKQLEIYDKSDNTKQIVTLIEEKNTDDYIYYLTIVVLSNHDINYVGNDLVTKTAKMYLMLNKKTNEITIDNVLIKSSDDKDEKKDEQIVGGPYNVVTKLEDFEYITFIITPRVITNENGEYTTDWKDDGHVVMSLKISDLSFQLHNYTDDKEYYAVFKIWDVYGNISYSKLVKMN